MINSLALLVLFLLTSCLNEMGEKGPQLTTPVEGLHANSNFDWKTSREVEVTVTGLSIDLGVKRRLSLLSEDGTVFYSGTHSMSEDFVMEFELPNHVHQITMRYGNVDLKEEIAGSKVSFGFSVDNDNGDLE
ncbi:hypothetical protein [Negadavirga shengliensis]|uniref:Lipoprotein n=1 Tax=Negadavirga shengliensis TaxID=1389218 RepID=A0ABV9T5S4_9BACT